MCSRQFTDPSIPSSPPLLIFKIGWKKFGDSDEQQSVVCPAHIQVSVSLFFLFFYFFFFQYFFKHFWSIKQHSTEKQSAKEEKKINLSVQFVSLSLSLPYSLNVAFLSFSLGLYKERVNGIERK